jgi:inorganic phosphate transporter, PiT family
VDPATLMLVTVVVTALAFDFTNGFHDTANAMAAPISTGAIQPRVAVTLSALLNFVGAFLSIEVAATIAGGIVDSTAVTLTVVFAGLIGGITWNLVTWLLGLPSSSSHALIGGVVGATLVAGGLDAVFIDGLVGKVVVPAVLAPVLAAAVAFLGARAMYRIHSGAPKDLRSRGYRIGQIGTASLMSLAHGTNDAQKTMGIITLALIVNGTQTTDDPPFWVIFACALAMGLGTYIGGWRIIRTLGKGLVDITAPQGFAAAASSTTVILAATHLGFPLSTTHVSTGSILGSGLARRKSLVRWAVAGRMALAWLVTLPAAGLVGAVAFEGADLIGGFTGFAVVFGIAVVAVIVLYRLSRRSPVDHRNVNDTWTHEGGVVARRRKGKKGDEPSEAPQDQGGIRG